MHLASRKVVGAFRYETEERVAVEVSVTLGSHASRTPMELLGFLIVLRVYVSFFRRRQWISVVKVDSAAALRSPLKLSSPRPSMNFIAAELVLLLETEDIVEVEGSHVPGKLNVNADYLSRPPLKLPPPPALAEVNIKRIKVLALFLLPGPGQRPDLWGRERPVAPQDRPESPALHRDTLSSSSWQ